MNDSLTQEHFKATLVGGIDMTTTYARTGYLGFMMPSATRDEAHDGTYKDMISPHPLFVSPFSSPSFSSSY